MHDVCDFYHVHFSPQELVFSYGHQDGDVSGAERDGPAAGLSVMPLAAGMLWRQVRKRRRRWLC